MLLVLGASHLDISRKRLAIERQRDSCPASLSFIFIYLAPLGRRIETKTMVEGTRGQRVSFDLNWRPTARNAATGQLASSSAGAKAEMARYGGRVGESSSRLDSHLLASVLFCFVVSLRPPEMPKPALGGQNKLPPVCSESHISRQLDAGETKGSRPFMSLRA